MQSKKRVLDALSHITPDKVPVDFDGTLVSGMHVSCVIALREYYGLEKKPVKVHEPYQMLGLIEDDLKDMIGVDTVGVNGRNTLFGFPNEDWKEWRFNNRYDVLVPGKFNITVDEEGASYIYPEGDITVPPSGKMPQNGFYFDSINRQKEIDEEKLDPRDNLEEFKPISDEELKYFESAMKNAYSTGKAVVANIGGTAIGDIALVPAPFLKYPKGIRGVEEWYVSTMIRQDYLHEVFEKQTDIAIENLKKVNEAAGKYLDVIFICGTDFGTQNGTFCSADTFNELYKPYYKKLNDWIHKNTAWKTFKHSCGAIEPFINLLAEAGFDILNPVQCSAKGMESEIIKEKYGRNMVFWGGGVDTQKVLPFGKPEEVRANVLSRLEVFSKSGGYIFNTIHNVQANTPVENIVAIIDAVKEFNGD